MLIGLSETFLILLLAAGVIAEGEKRSFTMELTVSPETPEGAAEVAMKAIEICDGLYPHLGHYKFTGNERVSGEPETPKFTIQQDVTCLSSPPVADTSSPADPAWKATEADERQVLDLTKRYFALADREEAGPIHLLWTPENREMVPPGDLAERLKQRHEKLGSPSGHLSTKITWYVNPDRAPRPGIYVAVDYELEYPGNAFNCGYLVWFRNSDGSYLIVREESGLLSQSDAAGLSPEKRAEMHSLLRCPSV
jgi:hypothetical protein